MASRVEERHLAGEVPLWVWGGWAERFPWLVQATTGAGREGEPFDLGLGGAEPVGAVLDRWRALRRATGMPVAVHARQVHGAELWVHRSAPAPGLLVMEGVDGHLTDVPGVLLTVSVADCVPVSLVDAQRRAVALLHAGWRGVAGGILERAVEAMAREYGSEPAALWAHCGPAICGDCYEVGPEVHRAVHPRRDAPPAPQPIDLAAALAARAAALGVPAANISRSAHCTRCGDGSGDVAGRRFFSHRAGDRGRQMGVLGIRP